MTRNAPAVFARLIGATDDNILELIGLELAAAHQRLHYLCEQIIRTDSRETSRLPAERCTHAVIDISIQHSSLPWRCAPQSCYVSETPRSARPVSQRFPRKRGSPYRRYII